MATGLEARIRRLEDSGGDGECPRCSGVVGIILDGEFWSANRHGEEMSEEEWRRHEAEEGEDGRCPVCGQKPQEITVGWPAP